MNVLDLFAGPGGALLVELHEQVALESRLAEVRDVLVNAADTPADRRTRIRQAVRLLEADLT